MPASVSLPALSAEVGPQAGHGCMSAAATLVDGRGKGTGLVGNGDSGPVDIKLMQAPLKGSFAAGGPTYLAYPMTCVMAGATSQAGAAVDLVIVDEAGQPVPIQVASGSSTTIEDMLATAPSAKFNCVDCTPSDYRFGSEGVGLFMTATLGPSESQTYAHSKVVMSQAPSASAVTYTPSATIGS